MGRVYDLILGLMQVQTGLWRELDLEVLLDVHHGLERKRELFVNNEDGKARFVA